MPGTSAPKSRRRGLWGVLTVVWLVGAVAGLSALWQFDNAPGLGATAPARWPADSTLARTPGQPTLVLLAHPQCSCTRASLDELGEALARARTPPRTYVLFLKPEGFGNGWEQTDSWRAAAAIPGVTPVRDDSGREASRFGAATSGQTLLYDADGTLLFSGGITASGSFFFAKIEPFHWTVVIGVELLAVDVCVVDQPGGRVTPGKSSIGITPDPSCAEGPVASVFLSFFFALDFCFRRFRIRAAERSIVTIDSILPQTEGFSNAASAVSWGATGQPSAPTANAWSASVEG